MVDQGEASKDGREGPTRAPASGRGKGKAGQLPQPQPRRGRRAGAGRKAEVGAPQRAGGVLGRAKEGWIRLAGTQSQPLGAAVWSIARPEGWASRTFLSALSFFSALLPISVKISHPLHRGEVHLTSGGPMKTDDELTRLILAGPSPTKAIRLIVTSRFNDITAARQIARPWKEIARALGLETQHKLLAAIYRRVRHGVETKGQPQARIPAPAIAPAPARQPQPRPAGTPGPSTPAPAPTKPGAPATAGRRVTKITPNPDDYV